MITVIFSFYYTNLFLHSSLTANVLHLSFLSKTNIKVLKEIFLTKGIFGIAEQFYVTWVKRQKDTEKKNGRR